MGGGVKYSNNANLSLNGFVRKFLNFKESFKKVLAFTLAETLIVIGIIGVVASLTIPNLNSTTADREKIAKLKKVYAQLNEAYARAQAVYGPVDEWFNGLGDDDTDEASNRVVERMTEFMKVSKKCSAGQMECLPTKVKMPDGSGGWVQGDTTSDDFEGHSFILADGTSVNVNISDVKTNFAISFLTFLDGPNKLATLGKNFFMFNVYKEFGTDSVSTGLCDIFKFAQVAGGKIEGEEIFSNNFWALYLQSTWAIEYGNLDYIEAYENGGKCKNGKQLKWVTQTSCK